MVVMMGVEAPREAEGKGWHPAPGHEEGERPASAEARREAGAGGRKTAAATAAERLAAVRQKRPSEEADWEAERELAGTRPASGHAVPRGRGAAALKMVSVVAMAATASVASFRGCSKGEGPGGFGGSRGGGGLGGRDSGGASGGG